MDRRKDYTRVPLWIRSSTGERSGGEPSYRQQRYWPQRPQPPQQPQQQRYEKPARKPRPERPPRQERKPRSRARPPRYEVIPTERVMVRNPLHLADWERRAQVVEDGEELVRRAEESGEAPWAIQVWKIGEDYVLARGFAALAAAVDAGLPEVRVVVAARFPRWELGWVDPKRIEGTDPLLSKALEAQKKIRTVGWVFPPLVVVPDGTGGYSLGRGKRAAARLWAAQAEGLGQVPIIVRPVSRRSVVAGTMEVEVSRVRVTLNRHLRKAQKPLPARLLNEVASGRLRPIRVRRTSDGAYELVDGLLRLRAAREVGLPTIQAIIEVDLPRE